MRRDFPQEYKARFTEVLLRHSAVFGETDPLPQTDFMQHHIHVTDETKLRVPLYRYSTANRKDIPDA